MNLRNVFKVATAILVLAVSSLFGTIARADAGAAAGHWTFDEGSGGSAADMSGNGNNGTLSGDASWSQSPKVGAGALAVHGAGYVDVPSSVIDTSQSYTVSAWVKVNKIGGYQTFVSVDGSTVSGFFLQLRDGGSFSLTEIPVDDTRGEASVATAATVVKPGVWYNVIGVHDEQRKTNSLYVNGSLQDEEPFTHSWKAAGHLVIGRGKYGGNPVDFVNGDIDDVTVSQTAKVDPVLLAQLQQDYPPVPSALTIDASKPGGSISPMLYGLMIEDISHSIDGGLYAELIRNRVFKDNSSPDFWTAENGSGAVSIAVDTQNPVEGTALTNSLKVDISSAGTGTGVSNAGYWGIPVHPGESYNGSFYAKSDGTITGPLSAEIVSTDGTTVYASTTVGSITTEWKQYSFKLTAGQVNASEANKFEIVVPGSGSLWLTQVSLFPPTFNNRPNGSRVDLMKELGAMHPQFLRLPGGNYLEGNMIADRFDWKKTIGPIDQRPGHNDPWGYRSTDGFGLLEYLDWCDDLGMEPVLAVYAGFSLSHEHVVAGPALQPFVQDALDEIQYLTGDSTTVWGARRIQDGHPAPFKLHYVEIGNEDFADDSGSYDGRFAAFHDAIKAAYPDLQLIATRDDVKSRVPDVVDDHYYRSAHDFESDWTHYDSYNRANPKVFVGEYASQDGRPTPNLRGALGDAAFMAGFERNGDVIRIASYAPLLVNVNQDASQWGTNLIGFDSLNSYVSPSYYTQQLFSLYHGDVQLSSSYVGDYNLPYCVNRSGKSGTIYLKVVNPGKVGRTVSISMAGVKSVSSRADVIVLKSGSDTDTNTIDSPNNVVPIKRTVEGIGKTFSYTFPPYSLTVMLIQSK